VIARHIHDALGQVRRLQALILERRFFEGYSGRARILSGGVALAAAAGLGCGLLPRTPAAHLAGWSVALAVALILNYGALAWWFLFDPGVRRNARLLKPAVDAVPALAVGAVLSVALVVVRQYDLLFGVWLSLYGLAQVAYRQSLPQGIYWVGLAYLACGAAALLARPTAFLNPWPMGVLFFLGELAGGLILLDHDGRKEPATDASPETPADSGQAAKDE
jgi:hypothetical protein